MTNISNRKRAATFVAALVLCFAICFGLSACSSSSNSSSTSTDSQQSSEPVRVMALNGPTGIGMAQLSEDTEKYETTFVGSVDEAVSSISNGSVDIAAVPTNLASTLYNKTSGGVKMIAVDTLGTLYIMENGTSISSIADLQGKTIYATGEGANPQYVLEYLLRANGLEPGVDVNIQYLSEHSELAALVANGEAEIAMLPEPFVEVAQTKNPDARIAIDLGAEWEQATGTELTMGCVIVRTEYLDEHPDQVSTFLEDLGTSIDAANNDTDTVAQLCADKGILPSAEIAEKAIPNCSLVLLTGDDMKTATQNFLSILASANAKSVGGELPADDFYYQAS